MSQHNPPQSQLHAFPAMELHLSQARARLEHAAATAQPLVPSAVPLTKAEILALIGMLHINSIPAAAATNIVQFPVAPYRHGPN